MWPLLAVLVLGQAGAAVPLRSADECAALGGSQNVWERAKRPVLARYCALVATAVAKLAGTDATPEVALALVREAEQLLPDHAAAKVVEGRANLVLDRPREAAIALEEAFRRDPHAGEDPVALLAWAESHAKLGDHEGALRGYRTLLPKASVFGNSRRGLVYFQAAAVAAMVGPSAADEAVAFAEAATRQTPDGLAAASARLLALALARAGDDERARAALASSVPANSASEVAAGLASVGASALADALEAIAQERSSPALARDAWTRYLRGPGGEGPWAAHARARLARVERPGPRLHRGAKP